MPEWCPTCENTTGTIEVHLGLACQWCKGLRPSKPYEDTTQPVRIFWTAPEDAYRYSIHNATSKPVEPRTLWQVAEYQRVMGKLPPDLTSDPDPQFSYNPRTKAGKTLLEELTNDGS